MASSRFCIWERSFWQVTTMPVGHVRQAHGSAGLLHVLAARAGGAEDIHLHVVRIDGHLDVVLAGPA